MSAYAIERGAKEKNIQVITKKKERTTWTSEARAQPDDSKCNRLIQFFSPGQPPPPSVLRHYIDPPEH